MSVGLAMVAAASALTVGVAGAQPGPPARRSGEIALIIPGEAIGPIRIGMTATQVRDLAGRLPCEIAVAYAAGLASRLETNCGVAYQTHEGITVGLDGSRIRWAFGPPELTVPSNLPGTRADWWVYRGPGISFRVIYSETGDLIQAIAIFKGTGEPLQRPVAPPLAPPLPPVGD
jgi:hypothetical protein